MERLAFKAEPLRSRPLEWLTISSASRYLSLQLTGGHVRAFVDKSRAKRSECISRPASVTGPARRLPSGWLRQAPAPGPPPFRPRASCRIRPDRSAPAATRSEPGHLRGHPAVPTQPRPPQPRPVPGKPLVQRHGRPGGTRAVIADQRAGTRFGDSQRRLAVCRSPKSTPHRAPGP